jgi:hypothetical protein
MLMHNPPPSWRGTEEVVSGAFGIKCDLGCEGFGRESENAVQYLEWTFWN